jgi:hypothetical protein
MNSATPNTHTVDGQDEEIACTVHSTHSSTREKALEHIFLGDLLRSLWRRGIHDVEILRPEIDRNGYEFVIGCNGIRRSIQLKTTRKNGKAQAVTVNCRLDGAERLRHLDPFRREDAPTRTVPVAR